MALLIACGGGARPDDGPTFGVSVGGTDADADSGGDATGTGADPDADPDPEPMLDLGQPDNPLGECASVTQTTTIDQRPVDIVIVGAGDAIVLPDYDFRWWVNEIPAHPEAASVDARVVVVVGGTPSMHMENDAGGPNDSYGCEQWFCDHGNSVAVDVVDATVPAVGPMQGVLDTSPQWLDLLRPEARKHIMAWVPNTAQMQLSPDEFVAGVTALGESFAGFVFHAMAHGATGLPPGNALRGATDVTGGLYDDGDTDDVDAGFFDAVMEQIQISSIACEYDIPEPPVGFTFDPEQINVEYDEGMGLETIGYVPSAADCAAAGAGWHYDDEANPTEIIMCPFTCERFDSADNATIEIKFGCATIPAG
ncbi:MAG: hypothetical protein AAF721_07215 [Myxococcota bacterium]